MTTRAYIPKAILRKREKPFLIWIGPGLIMLSVLPDIAFATLLVMQNGPGTIQVWDQTVRRSVYALMVYPLIVAAAMLSLTAAYGLWDGRVWARGLLTKWAAVSTIAVVVALSLALRLPVWIVALRSWLSWVFLALSFWYFYHYGPVQAYYRTLETRSRRQSSRC